MFFPTLLMGFALCAFNTGLIVSLRLIFLSSFSSADVRKSLHLLFQLWAASLDNFCVFRSKKAFASSVNAELHAEVL